jgi:hypothetical protein
MEGLHGGPDTVVMLNIRDSGIMDGSALLVVEDVGAVKGIVYTVLALIIMKLGCTKLEFIESLVSKTGCWDFVIKFIESNVAVAPVTLDNELEDEDAKLLYFTVEVRFTD